MAGTRKVQLGLDSFSAECEEVGMRTGTSGSEAMVLRKRCDLCVGKTLLLQVEELKYLGVVFRRDGRMEQETERRTGAVPVLGMLFLYPTDELRSCPHLRSAAVGSDQNNFILG